MSFDMQHYASRLLCKAVNHAEATFRPGQWQAIEALVRERARLLVVQRTGWGKSLVYFIATRLLRDEKAGPTLLISPLLALMRNQIMAAERLGLRAATINSSNRDEWAEVKSQLFDNEVDLLLISPERLANDAFRQKVLLPMSNRVGLFVVDEAHCISDWGHDFRPDYRRIVRILQTLPPNVPVLATTATANDRVVQDIVAQLGANLRVIRGSLARQSLRLQTITLPTQATRMAWLAEQLPGLPGCGIIYTLTVRDAERLASWLQKQGIDAYAYSGKSDGVKREQLEQRLLDNELKALVATSALGMGFDKPDLGFVIHFQRPGSVVHYYQQVGRAGRALEEAYGILLSGEEDQSITNYFIKTAFPPQAHVQVVLNVLNRAEEGLKVTELEQQVNLSRSQIRKVLKMLVVESPSPVTKEGSLWYATPISYQADYGKIATLIQIRHAEQKQMEEYVNSERCLMAFLRQSLDDPHAAVCGRCAICIGKPLLPDSYSFELANKANEFLRRSDEPICPRKLWPGDALAVHDFAGRIAQNLQFQEGRALCRWGDAGWGERVKRGKQVDARFDDRLVRATMQLVRQRWQPHPSPTWVTCVPSLTHRRLVPDFARRLAQKLRLPFVPCIRKIRPTAPQKLMHNSYQQAKNLAGAFAIDQQTIRSAPVLLVDDMVDSRWTFTVISALLQQAGSGPVFPLALAMTMAG